jgi:hypothetical protein
VERAEAAEEAGVVDEGAPVLGDEGGAEEVDWLRREAQEDLQEEVVRRKRKRLRRSDAVAGESVHWDDWEEPFAAAAAGEGIHGDYWEEPRF